MLGYVTVGTNDLERAATFYDAIAKEMGVGRMMEFPTFIAWGEMGGAPGLAATKPFDGEAATVGNGMMVALEAKDTAQVHRLHEIALENGGSDEGAPGPRGEVSGNTSAMPCSAAQRCAPDLVIAFSWVQVRPDRNHSTGTGPSCASTGRNSPKVISVPVASLACE